METQTCEASARSRRGWFALSGHRSSELKARIFCFAHAGGDGRQFLAWSKRLPPGVELVGVSLPGRGSRINEAPWSSMSQLVQRLSIELEPYAGVPSYFFGHSFGAMLAFALAIKLAEERPAFPLHGLIVSSCRPPHLGPPYPWLLHERSRDSFFDELRKFDGLPDEVFAHRTLLQCIERPLRADIQALELWVRSRGHDATRLAVPIFAVGGRGDPSILVDDLAEWRKCTSAFHSVLLAEGGHFYFTDNSAPLLDVLHLAVRPALEAKGVPRASGEVQSGL